MDDGHCDLRFTRRYDATPAEVWAAVTEPESIGRWLARAVEVALAPGEHARVHAPLGMRYMSRWSSALARIGAEVAA